MIMMSVLIHDARQELFYILNDNAYSVHELLFADDTLIVTENPNHAEIYMHCIQMQGMYYGLSFKWDKFKMICIVCNPCIAKPDGSRIHIFHSIIYLGALLTKRNNHIRLESSNWHDIFRVLIFIARMVSCEYSNC